MNVKIDAEISQVNDDYFLTVNDETIKIGEDVYNVLNSKTNESITYTNEDHYSDMESAYSEEDMIQFYADCNNDDWSNMITKVKEINMKNKGEIKQ